ncbi:MAG: baseplate J/gp47 family protein [Marinagarivorans sp.]|nr:baseplate J/gp47 family protein [Marinagarivorans sp.]
MKTSEISANIIAQLEATLNQTIPALPVSFIKVLARALAGVFVLLYKYAGWMTLQLFVRTASYADTTINGVVVNPLQAWGQLIGVTDLNAATAAELTISVTVTTQTGSLPAFSQLVGPQGITYLTLSSVLLNASTVSVVVRAQTTGTVGNLGIGSVLAFANPLANVGRSAAVTAQTVTAADAETVDSYRQRVIDRFAKRPQGGAYSDYEGWGEEASGILNVYPYTSQNPGQVDLYVEAVGGIVPTTPQLEAVLASVELSQDGLASRRPVGALVNAFPIILTEFSVTITGLDVADQSSTRAAITSAVEDYFLSREPFIVGLSLLPRADRIARTGVDGVVSAIVAAAGGFYVSSTLEADSTAIEVYTLGVGEKSRLDEVVFDD